MRTGSHVLPVIVREDRIFCEERLSTVERAGVERVHKRAENGDRTGSGSSSIGAATAVLVVASSSGANPLVTRRVGIRNVTRAPRSLGPCARLPRWPNSGVDAMVFFRRGGICRHGGSQPHGRALLRVAASVRIYQLAARPGWPSIRRRRCTWQLSGPNGPMQQHVASDWSCSITACGSPMPDRRFRVTSSGQRSKVDAALDGLRVGHRVQSPRVPSGVGGRW